MFGMASAPEYNLRDLGPWEAAGGGGDEATTTLWVSPNPLLPGQDIYYSEVSGRYVNAATATPIYFAGTDPRDPGFPPPDIEAEVGNPRVQWERNL